MRLATKGRVDFAVFDAHTSSELCLMVSGDTIPPGAHDDPDTSKVGPRYGVLVCQYLLDSLRSDAFLFAGGGVFEG